MRQRHGTIFRLLNEESGSALLEFAFICILLLMLLFGIAGMGQMLYSYHFVSSVARDASRWAAVNGATCGPPPAGDNSCNGTAPMNSGPASLSDIQTYVTNHTPQGIASAQVATNATWPVNSDSPPVCATVNNSPGCTVDVTVTYTYNFIFPLISTSPLTLSSTSEMIIAH